MKLQSFSFFCAAFVALAVAVVNGGVAVVVAAEPAAPVPGAKPGPATKPAPVANAGPAASRATADSSGQRVYLPQTRLVTPEAAAAIQDRFRAAYPGLGSPRFLLHVNRELVDTRSGLRVVGRDETVVNSRRSAGLDAGGRFRLESTTSAKGTSTVTATGPASLETGPASLKVDETGTGETVTTVNRYEHRDRRDETVEERQAVRDLERVIGRRLRSAGAVLADQRVATALMADRPLRDVVAATEGEQARKDREALGRIADVAIEVLIVERESIVQRVSGDVAVTRPEIQVTAIRLSDARILALASSVEVLGSGPGAAQRLLRNGLGEIADATVLRLMDDMMLGVEGK